MNNVLITAFSLLLFLSACRDSGDHRDMADATSSARSEAVGEVYTCPMHPSVISDRPGACPVCGMALVRKSKIQEASGDEMTALRSVSLSPTQRVLANVTTVKAERGTINQTIRAAGVVTYAEPLFASVAARFRGRIERLHVDFTGIVVKSGDPLFELYSPDLISAEQDFLLARQSTTPDILESSRDRLRRHYGMTLSQVERLVRDGTVHPTVVFHAPLGGTVLSKNVREGDYVEEGTVLYEVADLSTLWILFDVYEAEIRHVKIGQEVTMRTDVYPGESFKANVAFIDPVMDAGTRTVRVRTVYRNTGGRLKPDMYVTGEIAVAHPDVVIVPTSAVLSLGDHTVVWIEVKENTFEPRDVTLGVRTPNTTEVLNGIAPGEAVAATGGYLLDSESLLQSPATGSTHAQHQDHTSYGTTPKSTPLEREITILVKGGYSPEEITVEKGEPVTLHFVREEKSACTEELVIPALNIRQNIPAFAKTTIRFTPTTAGVIPFHCGMEMLHGRIIVNDGRHSHD